KMKPRFGSRPHPQPRETHREVGAIRQTNSALHVPRRALLLLLLPQELQKYDPRGARLQPLALADMAPLASIPSPASHLFRPRSTRCLPLCHLKRCAPNREEPLLQPANMQTGDGLTVQSNPMPSVPR